MQNLNADQLAALQVTNTGTAPLWVRLDSSGYPQSAPQPTANVLKIERQFLATDGSSKSLSSLKSGELVLVWLEVTATQNVPDALVVDLLPAGLELENQNLASSSASLQCKTCSTKCNRPIFSIWSSGTIALWPPCR